MSRLVQIAELLTAGPDVNLAHHKKAVSCPHGACRSLIEFEVGRAFRRAEASSATVTR